MSIEVVIEKNTSAEDMLDHVIKILEVDRANYQMLARAGKSKAERERAHTIVGYIQIRLNFWKEVKFSD